MKKCTLLLALISLSTLAFSQVEKGAKLVGVNFAGLSFTSSESSTSYSNTITEYKSTGTSISFSVNPSVAWFIADRFALGSSVSVGFYNSKSNNSNTSSSSTSENKSTQPSLYIGPFARLYFGGSSKGMPFAQIGLQYGFYGGKSKSSNSGGASSETITKPNYDYQGGLTFGYEQFISKYLGIYGSFGLNYGKTKTTYEYHSSSGNDYNYTSEYGRFYIPISLGVQVHVPSKNKKK